MMKYTALIIKVDDWYAATVKELSGVNTQGRTIEEVKVNLAEAIELIIESNIRHFMELGDEFIEEDIFVNA